jgi:exopolysaccharide biosynthesis polyprenyl glycosylphosphotransferase
MLSIKGSVRSDLIRPKGIMLETIMTLDKPIVKKNARYLFVLCIILLDFLAIFLAFTISNNVHKNLVGTYQRDNVMALIIPIYFLIGLNTKSFHPVSKSLIFEFIRRGISNFVLSVLSMLLILFFFKTSSDFSRMLFFIGSGLSLIFISASRTIVARCFDRFFGDSVYSVVHIFDGIENPHPDNRNTITASPEGVFADASSLLAISNLGRWVSGVDHLIVHCSPERRDDWVFMLHALDVESEIIMPELDDLHPLAIRSRDNHISLVISAGNLRWDQRLLKRAFDVVISATAIILLSPFILVTALAIRLESSGPALFTQQRIGLGNRSFKMYKFRSMHSNMSDATGSKLTERGDPRVTRIGAFIRRTSIDEIPQLFNVLNGTMSLVGPRPHAIQAKAGGSLYWEVEQRYWHRHSVKPGITGLAQVSGHRGNTFVEDDLRRRLNADLDYVAQWSIMIDLKILIKTIFVIRHSNAF